MALSLSRQYGNIENDAQPGRPQRLLGYSATGRVFRIYRAQPGPDKCRANAVTPRDGMVNRLTGPTLASISNQLSSTS